MTTTTTLYASGTPTQVAGTWTNPTNATGAPNATGTTAPTNCATWVNAARSTVATLELAGYNFSSQVPSGAVVNSVTATIPHAETSTTNISALTAQLYSGATAIGTAQTITRVTSLATATISSWGALPTAAQLTDLRVRVTSTRANNTTSSTQYIDACGLVVDYTVPAAISTLTDNFTTQDTTKWTWGTGTSVVSGQAQIVPTSSYPMIASVAFYDLTGSAFGVQIVQRTAVGNGTTDTQVVLALDPNNVVKFVLEGATLYFQTVIAGTQATVANVAYSATTHAWWQFRESGGTTFYDTSSDGTTWTQQASAANPFAVTSVQAQLQAGYYGTEPSPGTAIFDNVNTVPLTTAAGTITLGGSASPAAAPTAAGAIALGGAVTAPTISASASGALALGGTAAPTAPQTAAGTVTLGGSATGQARPTTNGTITLGATVLPPTVNATAAGALTLGGTTTGRAASSATGAITLGATAAATAPVTAAGSVTLGGAPVARAATTAAGTVTLGGSATGTINGVNTAAGTITLGGSSTANARPTTTGAITLGGSSAAQARPTAGGVIVLGGTPTARVASTTAGAIALSGLANAAAAATGHGTITLGGSATGTAVVADTYHPHVYVTAVLTGNGTGTATIASSAATATLAQDAGLGTSPLGTSPLGGWQTTVTATITPIAPATAVLAGNGVGTATVTPAAPVTAVLAATAPGTATLTEVYARADLQLV